MKAALLLLPALALLPLSPATAQQLDRQPAASSQPPRVAVPGDRAGPPSAPARPPVGVGTPRTQPPSTQPPPGHQTLQAPSVPGAARPDRSEGITDFGRSPVPDRPGARPDASTTTPPDRR
ncbi:hypothetical protein ACLF3G_19155 [Falsiroseomonas sp. HC035]|uniref:hypothetical protein n=1 Tax=Falsiroseomonas sp. HC035 TaxID=3390999 RepID=UPI003D31D099